MVNYPTILGLPQEDIDRQLYVGVLGLESRVKALENKPKPTPTQTGTVTVTATVYIDEETQYPIENGGLVALATEQIDWTNPDPTKLVAVANIFDETGTATLALVGGQSTDIPFGTYYLLATDNAEVPTSEYSGTLTVDGDETVTITLTPIEEGD